MRHMQVSSSINTYLKEAKLSAVVNPVSPFGAFQSSLTSDYSQDNRSVKLDTLCKTNVIVRK